MSADGAVYFTDIADTRNVRAQATTRKKLFGMVTKSYNHKEVEKILEMRQLKFQREAAARELAKEKEDKKKEDAQWILDQASKKKQRRNKERAAKAEEKARRREEMMKFREEDSFMNGVKGRSKHH